MGKKERRRKSGVGAFFGGTFFGFLLGIAAIVGLGAFAYFKVSPQWINNTFKTEIDLGNEEINSKTISDVVNTLIGIGENSDTYSFDDLKNDFGVELPNDLMGIDIQDLKSVPLAELADAVQNKLSNISAKEIENLFSSESLDNIMGKTVTYYYNEDDGKLYKDLSDASTVATFDYTIVDENSVEIKKFDPISIDLTDNSVEIILELLPLTTAIDEFVGNLGDNITLQELKVGYGVDLPDFIYNGNETRKVNELQIIMSELTIGKILNVNVKYNATDKKYYNDKNNNSTLDTGEEEVSSIVAAMADSTINSIQDTINTLTLDKVFPNPTGVLALIKNPNKVLLTGAAYDDYITINAAIDNVIKESTLEDLIQANVITSTELSSISEKWINKDYFIGGTNYVQVKDLKINELIAISSKAFSMVPGFLKDSKPAS